MRHQAQKGFHGIFIGNLHHKKGYLVYVPEIDGSYRIITLNLKKGNLPLYFENYSLFLLPPIFTKYLYTYP